MLDGEVDHDAHRPGRAVDAQPPRAGRRRHRHRQDEDAAAPRGPTLGRGGAGLHLRHQRRRVGLSTPATRASRGPRAVRVAGGPTSRAPIRSSSCRSRDAGAPVRATVSSFGPLLLGKVLDLNETQIVGARRSSSRTATTALPLLDLTILVRPSSTSLPMRAPRSSRTTAGVCRDGRGPPPIDRGPRGRASTRSSASPSSRSVDLLRTTTTARASISHARARRRDGPASALLHVHALDARAAVRDAAGGRRPPQPKLAFFFDEAHLLFHDAQRGADGADRAHRPAHPLEGRGRVLRDTVADRRPVVGAAPLGNRVQHALRAFTPDDADDLRKTARPSR